MPNVLTINAGSSSIRFAIFAVGQTPTRLLQGKLDRIGSGDASLTVDQGADFAPMQIKAGVKKHGTAIDFLLDWLESQPLFNQLSGVGHRVVHGMLHSAPERVTSEVLNELKSIIPFDPEHMPRAIELIEALQRRYQPHCRRSFASIRHFIEACRA